MSGPVPATIPHGRTARRLQWAHLPPALRALIERRCGSPIVQARSQDAGFSPGFASVLLCADGSRHFVKAASGRAQRAFAASYREEARTLTALPPIAPAPRLRWSLDDPDWVVLGIEYVDAVAPQRPWRRKDLDRCLELTATMARDLTPAPEGLALDTFAEDCAGWPAYWDDLRANPPDLPHLTERLDEAAALAAGFAEVCAGSTLVHVDIRDDNLLLCRDGRTLLCDWNWPVLGAAWLDTVLLLLGPRGDGLDVEQVLATHATTRDLATEHVDRLLALASGYFLKSAGDPVPSTSPHVRAHQRWQGEVSWKWLSERRGWS